MEPVVRSSSKSPSLPKRSLNLFHCRSRSRSDSRSRSRSRSQSHSPIPKTSSSPPRSTGLSTRSRPQERQDKQRECHEATTPKTFPSPRQVPASTTEGLCSNTGTPRKKSNLSFSIDNILGRPCDDDFNACERKRDVYWANVKPALRIPQPNFEERIVQVYHINTDHDGSASSPDCATVAGMRSSEPDADDEAEEDRCTTSREDKSTRDAILAKNESITIKDPASLGKFDDYDEDGVNSSDEIDVTFAVDEDNVDDDHSLTTIDERINEQRGRSSFGNSPPRQLRLNMPRPHYLYKVSIGGSEDGYGSSPDASRNLARSYCTSSPKSPFCRNVDTGSNNSLSSSFSSPLSLFGRSINCRSTAVPPFWPTADSEVKPLERLPPPGLSRLDFPGPNSKSHWKWKQMPLPMSPGSSEDGPIDLGAHRFLGAQRRSRPLTLADRDLTESCSSTGPEEKFLLDAAPSSPPL
ncbi:hypothetical protein ElyMa_001208700 [Elysia marginata]|uniref:Uncharacterized protein n=1 Tax=Elysia marginata TaxID=1093978 RepID=A0AAV4I9S7_9GAST|nr:hypothetical protein ElyMa_001208700 [Elysia marginata]